MGSAIPRAGRSTEAGYKDGPVKGIDALFDKGITEVDPVKRYGITQQIIQLHVDKGPFMSAPSPTTRGSSSWARKLMNVPTKEDLIANGGNGGVVNAWLTPYPGLLFPETWA